MPKLGLARFATFPARLGSAWEILARTHPQRSGKINLTFNQTCSKCQFHKCSREAQQEIGRLETKQVPREILSLLVHLVFLTKPSCSNYFTERYFTNICFQKYVPLQNLILSMQDLLLQPGTFSLFNIIQRYLHIKPLQPLKASKTSVVYSTLPNNRTGTVIF